MVDTTRRLKGRVVSTFLKADSLIWDEWFCLTQIHLREDWRECRWKKLWSVQISKLCTLPLLTALGLPYQLGYTTYIFITSMGAWCRQWWELGRRNTKVESTRQDYFLTFRKCYLLCSDRILSPSELTLVVFFSLFFPADCQSAGMDTHMQVRPSGPLNCLHFGNESAGHRLSSTTPDLLNLALEFWWE